MSFEDERDSGRGRKSATSSDGHQPETSKSRRKRAPTGEVGQALRAAYQRTVSEDIPPEMLDLLGRLG